MSSGGVTNHSWFGCSTVYSGANQTKHQTSATLAFVEGIHRWSVNYQHKGPVAWKMFQLDDVIMVIDSTTEYHYVPYLHVVHHVVPGYKYLWSGETFVIATINAICHLSIANIICLIFVGFEILLHVITQSQVIMAGFNVTRDHSQASTNEPVYFKRFSYMAPI